MDESQFPMMLRAPSPQNRAPRELRVEALAPTPQNRAPGELRVEALAPKGEDHHVDHADDERRDEPRRGMLRRPFAVVGGLILLFVALPAGYLYWDYSIGDRLVIRRQ